MKRLFAYLLAISIVFLPLMTLTALISPRWVLPLLMVVTIWLIWGAKIATRCNLTVQQPVEDNIDVKNALRMLWCAAWWPRYL